MRTELKRKWIKALRSGKYKQTDGMLRFHDGFCCLGVLADIKGCDWNENEPLVNGKPVRATTSQYLWEEFADLTQNQQSHYAGMNDDGKSFKEIAAAIERTIRR